MILTGDLKLEAVLAGAVSASQPEIHVDYVDHIDDGSVAPPATSRIATNNTTDVTVLGAVSGRVVSRDVIRLTVYNKDSASVTVTIKTDDGTTEYIERKSAIATTKTLNYEKGVGWYPIIVNATVG